MDTVPLRVRTGGMRAWLIQFQRAHPADAGTVPLPKRVRVETARSLSAQRASDA
jgi:hypothetical protein